MPEENPFQSTAVDTASEAAVHIVNSAKESEDIYAKLTELYQNGELCDIALSGFGVDTGADILKGESIAAHRVILAARSPVLLKKLRNGGEWAKLSNIPFGKFIPDVSVARLVLQYLYSDRLDMPASVDLKEIGRAIDLYSAACVLEIKPLEKLASGLIVDNIRLHLQQNETPCSQWFSAVLAVLKIFMNGEVEGILNPELAKRCMDTLRESVDDTKPSENRSYLMKAMHEPLFKLGKFSRVEQCDASVCSAIILACVGSEKYMEWGVLIGRADILLDLLARGVDPDARTSIGLFPVELALKLAKQKGDLSVLHEDSPDSGREETNPFVSGFREKKHRDNLNVKDALIADIGFPVSWVTLNDMNEIVKVLIMSGRNNSSSFNDSSEAALDVQLNMLSLRKNSVPLLNLAAQLGNVHHVQALIDSGAKVDEQDGVHGRSSLHCAAEAGFEDVVSVLLKSGAVPNQQDRKGCTVLHLAARKGHTRIVEILQAMVNENIPDNEGWTSLHHAAYKGHCEVARLLLQQSKDPLGFILATDYEEGSTAIHLASRKAHCPVILVILDCLRDLESTAASNHDTLHTAAKVAMIRSNRDRKSGACLSTTVNCKDLFGRTPLHQALDVASNTLIEEQNDPESSHSHFLRACKVAESLIDAGADLCARTKMDYLPLHFALGGKRFHFVEGDSRFGSHEENSSGFNAAKFSRTVVQPDMSQLESARNEDTAQLLSIVIGSRGGITAVNGVSLDGVTPLHCAVLNGVLSAVPLLLRHGADINAYDRSGESPLSLARKHWPMSLLASCMLNMLRVRPSWVPDALENCQICDAKWSVTVRRHHCRHCASLVCSNCSGERLAIPKYDIVTPVRVCNICYDSLSWPAAMKEAPAENCSKDFSRNQSFSPSAAVNVSGQTLSASSPNVETNSSFIHSVVSTDTRDTSIKDDGSTQSTSDRKIFISKSRASYWRPSHSKSRRSVAVKEVDLDD